jgi:uncharacterized protein with HEPN domain
VTPPHLQDVLDACDAIVSVLSGVEFDEYHATRLLRSAVEREFTIIGEAVAVLSRLDAQLFSRLTHGRRIVDFRNQLTHAYLPRRRPHRLADRSRRRPGAARRV